MASKFFQSLFGADDANKFYLPLKDGVAVHDLKGLLREFDLDSVMQAFKSGKLLEWLRALYYEEEAAAVEEIDQNDREAAKKICAVFGVDYRAQLDEELDRSDEAKRLLLSRLTSDEDILDNASITALDQRDLAELLDRDAPKIYLCGEEFNVPIGVGNKYYIGILGRPQITTRAKSPAEFSSQDIFFEGVDLPWSYRPDPDELRNYTSRLSSALKRLKELLEAAEHKRRSTAKCIDKNVYEGSTVVENYVIGVLEAEVISFKAMAFDSKIFIKAKGNTADAKAYLMIPVLGLTRGTEITITAAGPDAQHAVEELLSVINMQCGTGV